MPQNADDREHIHIQYWGIRIFRLFKEQYHLYIHIPQPKYSTLKSLLYRTIWKTTQNIVFISRFITKTENKLNTHSPNSTLWLDLHHGPLWNTKGNIFKQKGPKKPLSKGKVAKEDHVLKVKTEQADDSGDSEYSLKH